MSKLSFVEYFLSRTNAEAEMERGVFEECVVFVRKFSQRCLQKSSSNLLLGNGTCVKPWYERFRVRRP